MHLPSAAKWDTVYRVVLALGLLVGMWWLVGTFAGAMGAHKSIGAFGLLLAAPVAGKLLAPVMFDGLAWGYRNARWLALHDLQGNYYAYKGNAIGVLEGDDGFRWLRVRDVRHTLRSLPKDATLRLMEPERTEFDESGKQLAVRADALLHWLSKAHTDENIRFKVWLERSIHNPSLAVRREKEKSAIRKPVV